MGRALLGDERIYIRVLDSSRVYERKGERLFKIKDGPNEKLASLRLFSIIAKASDTLSPRFAGRGEGLRVFARRLRFGDRMGEKLQL